MSTENQFVWVDFYKEFAGILRTYKNKRSELIKKVRQIYEITGIKLPTLETDNQIIDIDPFTVFGLFNKNITDANRLSILEAIAKLFEVKTEVPESFYSIPTLDPRNSTFYDFIGYRGDDDIDDLWGLYDSALDYAVDSTVEHRDLFSIYFDRVISMKGIGNSKITMALYWISPDKYLNLDQCSIGYIYKSGSIPDYVVQTLPAIKNKISSDDYLQIVEKLCSYLQSDASKLKDFKELSLEAWNYSKRASYEKKTGNAPADKPTITVSLPNAEVKTPRYWIYSPGTGASIWNECYDEGIMAIGWDEIGDLSIYTSKDEMKQAMKEKIDPLSSFKQSANITWQFVHDVKPGDIIFAKKGRRLVVGRGVVESDYIFDSAREPHKNVRKVKWTQKGEWDHPGQAVMKTLTDITRYTDYVRKLNALFAGDTTDDVEEPDIKYAVYKESDFLKDVYMDKDSYETLAALVRNKKNVILQGAPGVGKTYAAERLAYSMMGIKDTSRVKMVQFHQSYSYEEFIMGLRPTESGGYELHHGTFYNFCKEAEIDSDNDYFFIIDEINRGNLSKIFGELFMLVESDKRGKELQLLYSDEKFSVPENVYIIGMMNTADRSLAMVDYALRRRFAFFEMKPGFETDGFKKYAYGLESDKFNKLVDCVKALNDTITSDDSLGAGFCIGHSYFCVYDENKPVTEQTLSRIVEYELIPLLKEYWFDESENIKIWSEKLRSAIK